MDAQELSMDDAIKQSMNGQPAAEAVVEEVATTVITPVGEEAVTITVIEPAAPVFDEAAWIKQHFGEEITSVDALKEKLIPQPKVVEPLKFENETSKKIYEALLSGKENEVTEYLTKKQFVNSLKEKSPEEIVKAGWKTEFGLTDAEANRRFNKQFSVDEFAEDEDKAYEQKIIAKTIEREAENYKKFFADYDQKITLPSLEQEAAPASAAPQVDYTSEAAKRAIAFSESLNKPVDDIANIPFEFSDTNLTVKGKVAIPNDEVTKIKTQLEGQEDKFIENRWFKNGEFNLDLFARDVYLITHPQAVANAATSQVAHKAREQFLKENRNYQPAGQVITGDFMPSEAEQKREWYRKNFM